MTENIEKRITGIVFVIGIIALAIRGDWWPGILVVLGITNVASGLLQREHWKTISGLFWLAGLYLVFSLGQPWWLLIVLTVVGIVFGARHHRGSGEGTPEWAQQLQSWGERMQKHADKQSDKPKREEE